MTKFEFFHLKNDMLGSCCLANLVGVILNTTFLMGAEGPVPEEVWQNPIADVIDSAFTPAAFIFVAGMALLYERPIRSYLNMEFKNHAIPEDLKQRARQRVLNEPFVLIALSFSMWLLSAMIYPLMFWILDVASIWIQRSFFMGLSTGLITITVAFFLLEHVLQERLAPHFFPNGGLYSIPKTMRIRIHTRLAALLLATNLIPLITIILILHRVGSSQSEPAMALSVLRTSIYINAVVFLVSGIFLTMLVIRNLTTPFGDIIQTLRSVRNGNFATRVRVTSNDEIGYTGDVINEMTEGLKERDRIRQSLVFAMEVQQQLMPGSDPNINGLDIAGASIYCEETGGDYYDYLLDDSETEGKVGVVVGDVSDHGIPSALLMSTARAFLRQRASRSGDLSQIVTDVNRQLARDVKDSGRFMTLFVCVVDRQHEAVHWVNAGHEPAFVYDPGGGHFEELTGGGLPLGVSRDAGYQQFRRAVQPGQIILIGTDGIWESANQNGAMFGKDRFKRIVQQNANRGAKDMLHAVIHALEEFQRPLQKTDDVTLVVIKLLD